MKKHLFYTLLIIFAATAVITLLGVIEILPVNEAYLDVLVPALPIEIATAIISLFVKTNFFPDDNPATSENGDEQAESGPTPDQQAQTNSENECSANWVISEKNATKEGLLVRSGDSSDLFFVLLSVDDLERSRFTIVDVQASKHNNVNVEAMYHLMGSWDLLIKFRADNNGESFYHDVIAALIEAGRMSADPLHIYGRHELMNVVTQSRAISGLVNPKAQETVAYTVLANSDEYDKFRAARVFVYLQTQGELGSEERKAFLDRMDDAISNTYSSAIIESVCTGSSPNGLGETMMIETFSTCAQSNYIKHLNSAIEPILAHSGLQKYTLTCYHYDEKGLLKQVNGFEEGAI